MIFVLHTVSACLLGSSFTSNDSELVLKQYDLAAFTQSSGVWADAMSLLPYQWRLRGMDIDLKDSNEPLLDPDFLWDLCREVVSPQFWDEGSGSMDLLEGRYLWVTATPQIHVQLNALLQYLQENLLPMERLEVRCYEGEIAEIDQIYRGQSSADQKLEQWLTNGILEQTRQGSVTLKGGLIQRAESMDVEPMIYDWEVEIAAGAANSDDISIVVGSGLTLFVKGWRAQGGTFLDLMLRQSNPVRPTSPKRLRPTSSLRTNAGLLTRQQAGIVEHPALAFCSFAGSLFIPQSQALWVPVSLQTKSGAVNYLFDLRVIGQERPPHTRFELELPLREDEDSSQYFLELWHMGNLTSYGVGCSPLFNELFDPEEWQLETRQVTSILQKGYRAIDAFPDLLRSVNPEFDEDQNLSLQWSSGGGVLFGVTSPKVSERIQGVQEIMNPPPTMIAVKGELKRGGEESIGHFVCPIMAERTTAIWSGVQDTALIGWDVDVAQDATVPNPDFAAIVDGFAFRFAPHRTPDGNVLFNVQGKCNLLSETMQTVDMETDDGRYYQKAKSQSLYIDDARILHRQDTATLHWGDRQLSVELTVDPRPQRTQ